MSFTVPNTSRKLSPALLQRGSDLDQMVSVADEATRQHKFGAEATLNVTWELLKQACPDYEACMITTTVQGTLAPSVMCTSGQTDGRPYRFDCQTCRVSQFSRGGFFTGEIMPASAIGRMPEATATA
jgi:hypothetical protein